MNYPSVLDENSLNIPRLRTPKQKRSNLSQHSQINHDHSIQQHQAQHTHLNQHQPSPLHQHQAQFRSISRGSPRRFTPRKSPAMRVRPSASTPTLRTPSKRLLKSKRSRLDLLDNKNLTSFPSPPVRKTSNRSLEALNIVDNYFPVRREAEDDDWKENLREMCKQAKEQEHTWSSYIGRKLRWRWRLNGLFR